MINIMGHDWEVKLTTEPIGGDSESRAFLGQGDEAFNQIFIDGTMPQTRQEEVFLHEIAHQVTTGFPEMMIADIGRGLYGALKQNGLIPDDFLSRFVDGNATPDEMRRLNEKSQELMESPPMFFRVSESSWDGPAFDESGELTIHDADGKVNRNAAHLAAAQLAGARGGVALSTKVKRAHARTLEQLYKGELEEPIPSSLGRLVGR